MMDNTWKLVATVTTSFYMMDCTWNLVATVTMSSSMWIMDGLYMEAGGDSNQGSSMIDNTWKLVATVIFYDGLYLEAGGHCNHELLYDGLYMEAGGHSNQDSSMMDNTWKLVATVTMSSSMWISVEHWASPRTKSSGQQLRMRQICTSLLCISSKHQDFKKLTSSYDDSLLGSVCTE
jgi:hypothetical protein